MNEIKVNGKALNASAEGALIIELYLQENYLFRRNQLNGKVEFLTKKADSEAGDYRPLTQEALNSIILKVMKEGILEKGDPKKLILLYVKSEEVPLFNPIGEYLYGLPLWDGHNYVADLFSRLPGISTEQTAFMAIWLRSAVAHWLQMDTLHGNEVVPVLIGPQGSGKTTFLRRLLPQHLRQYYLDHLNLSNKFDKEMALTNNLLVNLDELEAIRPSQHATLKQTLSKNKVNGRPIYGCAQEDRLRFASFVASTNNHHPLTDATGSRRYICLKMTRGQFIDNTGEINYDQLYAQVIYELRELNVPYWFSNDEVTRLQELNMDFIEKKEMTELINACFRKPEEGEVAQSLTSTEALKVIQEDFPSVEITQGTKVSLGQAMKELGFTHTAAKNVPHYKVIPLKVA